MIDDLEPTELENTIQSEQKPLLVDFYTRTCQPCVAMLPIVEEVAAELGDVLRVVKFQADKDYALAAKHKVSTVPHFLIFKAGTLVDRKIGTLAKSQLKSWIEGLL